MVTKFYMGYNSQDLVNAAMKQDYVYFKEQGDVVPSQREYVDANVYNYTIAINTWFTLLEDISGQFYIEFAEYITRYGLVRLIDLSSNITNMIFTNTLDPTKLQCFGPLYGRLKVRLSTGQISMSDFLLCFRYLKRFSPQLVSVAERSTLDSFLKRNTYAKTQNCPSGRLSKLQYRVYQYMRPTIARIERYMPDVYDDNLSYRIVNGTLIAPSGALPNGSCFEGARTLAQKVLEVEKVIPFYLQTPGFTNTKKLGRAKPSLFTVVPKTYNKSRGIAMEECYRTVMSDKVSTDLAKALKLATHGRIDIHDQERNRILAKRAAISGRYATIDFSAASDSVYLVHVMSLFNKTRDALLRWRPDSVVLSPRRTIKLNLFATMGSRLTFPTECAIFLAMAEGAYRYYENLTGDQLDYSTIGIYGDDMIIDCRVTDIVFWFSRVLGFTVNTDKSYYSESQNIAVLDNSRYRESCGSEWLYSPITERVYDVAHPYYPRSGISSDDVGICTAIDLQHKLVNHTNTNQWLVSYLRDWFNERFPTERLTESYVGSDYADIWSYWPLVSTSDVPIYDPAFDPLSDTIGEVYEYHTVFTPVYTDISDSWRNTPAAKREKDAAVRLAYHRLLRDGNASDDALLRLLGCSTPPTSYTKLYKIVDRSRMHVGYTF